MRSEMRNPAGQEQGFKGGVMDNHEKYMPKRTVEVKGLAYAH